MVVHSPDGVIPMKPLRIIYPFQDQADRAILTQTSLAEAGRSDPGRRVDGTSDQRLSAVMVQSAERQPLTDHASRQSLSAVTIQGAERQLLTDHASRQRLSAASADQPKGDIQRLPLNLPEWAPLPQVVPSQSVASLGVLQDTDCLTPSERGPRRGPFVETLIPFRDRAVLGRLAIDARDLDRSRTSYGDASEPFEETLSRIMGDDGLNSVRPGIESAYTSEFAETEQILRSELVEALAKSILDVIFIASENIMQQQRAMAETLRQLDNAIDVRVQSDAVAARLALANAEQIMFQENAKELRRVVDLHFPNIHRERSYLLRKVQSP